MRIDKFFKSRKEPKRKAERKPFLGSALRRTDDCHTATQKKSGEEVNEKKAELPEVKIAEETLQWRVLNALHGGSVEQAQKIADKSVGEEASLVKGMIALWNGEMVEAERLLKKAAEASDEIVKCWGHLKLADLYLELSKDSHVDHHLSRARRYSYEDCQGKHHLSIMVDLTDARIDIERGAGESAKHTLNALLETCSDDYLRAMAWYLMGCLGRFEGRATKAARIEKLEKAACVLRERGDRYHTALADLELSDCAMELERAKEAARRAASEFEVLGRLREAKVARACIFELENATADSYGKKSCESEFVGELLVASNRMQAVQIKIGRMALEVSRPVLILGQRGTGKEMVARAIHMLGPRRDKPMIAINCAAIPEHLAESELFGYEKGAFTGAVTQKQGIFEAADEGTLFLDEIGELPLAMQVKLLRVLQDGSFRRLGGKAEIRTNARVIAATNRDPDEMVRDGKFREDLLDRLSWRLKIPPLDRRREDILPLAEHFLRKYGEGKYRFDSSAKAYLLDKSYPGNVRMLENDVQTGIVNAKSTSSYVVTSAMLVDDAETIDAEKEEEISLEAITNLETAMLIYERNHIVRVLAKCCGNSRAAREALGMSESTFWRALRRHGIRLGTRENIN